MAQLTNPQIPDPYSSQLPDMATTSASPQNAAPANGLTDQASAPAAAHALANNLDALAQNGHTYLDVPSQVALAYGGGSIQSTLAAASAIKSSIQSNKSLVDSFYADAAQNTPPSLTQSIVTQLHSLFGGQLAMTKHVQTIQQQMLDAGVVKGLPADGNWTDPRWQSALFKAQGASLSKPGLGNTDSKSTVQHIADALSYSHVLNFLINTVKALPRQVLTAIGDVVSVSTGDSAAVGGNQWEKNIATFGAKKANEKTLPQYEAQVSSPAQAIQDLGTFLQFFPLMKLGSKVIEHSTEGLIASDIAKNSVKNTAAEKLLGASRLTALQPLANVGPKYTLLNSIIQSAASGTPGLLTPSSAAIINKPVLGFLYAGLNKVLPPILDRIGPAVAKTAPIQMAVRDLLAQRLRLPIVQATNAIGLSATSAAIKLGVIAGAESKLGGRGGTFDSTVYGLGPIRGSSANILNIWGMQLNPGRTGAAQILDSTGETAQSLRNTFTDSGALHAFANANPQIDLGDLIGKHGIDAVNGYIGDQLNHIATNHAADFSLRDLKADPNGWANMTGLEKEALTKSTMHQIWRDSAPADSALNQSYQHILADMNAMETGFRNQGLNAVEDTRNTAYAKPYPDVADKPSFATTSFAGKVKKSSTLDEKISADKVMHELVKPENQQYLIQPGTLKTLAESKKDFHASQALAESDAIHEPVMPDAIPLPDPAILESAQADYQAKLQASKITDKHYTAVRDAEIDYKSKLKAKKLAEKNYKKTIDNVDILKSGIHSDPKVIAASTDLKESYERLTKAKAAPADTEDVRDKFLATRAELSQSHEALIKAKQDIKDAQKAQAQRIRANAPNPNVAKPELNAGWVEAHNPQAPDGMLGIMRIEGLGTQDNMRLVQGFRDQLQAAGKNPKKIDDVRYAVGQALLGEHGLSPFNLGEHDTGSLIDILEGQTDTLASNIYAVHDAPDHIKQLINELHGHRYKLIAGTDVGHAYTQHLIRDLGSEFEKSKSAKAATKLGLSPRESSTEAVSARTHVETMREIQSKIDNNKIDALPGFNASRIMAYIRQELPSVAKLTKGQESAMTVGKWMGNYDVKIAKLIKADSSLTKEAAWAQIHDAKIGEMGIRDIPAKTYRKVLTKPISDDIADLMRIDRGTPFMDEKSANQVIQGIWQGRLNVPSEMIGGLAKVEDWMYAGLGFGDKSFAGVSGQRLAEVPGTLFNLRSRVRYQESPLFAYRRQFKTMAKGITENVPPVLYPEAKMEEMGIASKADTTYRRIFPEKNSLNAFLDDAERLTSQADLFNLYSPRDYYRWGAYWLEKQGFSDDQIRQKMSNVMDYGKRTAAERSLNAVFFPLSFNKTLMRQFGGFLLTHPGQRMILATLMDQYDKQGGPEMLTWLEDHTPLIKEFEKLNAFEHGIGLGIAGGINAPYFQGFIKFMTMLGPKKIDYGAPSKNDGTLKTLGAYIPAVKEFTDLFMTSQNNKLGGRVGSTAGNLWDIVNTEFQKVVENTPDTIWLPTRHSSMGYALQQSEAWSYRNQLIAMLSKVLEYNYKNPNNRKAWPHWVPQETGLWGKAITKSSIGELVHYKYPAWDNAASAVIAQQKATETDRYIGAVSARNPLLGQTYRTFDSKAKSVSDAISRDSVSPDKIVALTDAFRAAAVQLSSTDSTFKEFYKTHYARTFGPLEVYSQ
jgi:hypothetical protein